MMIKCRGDGRKHWKAEVARYPWCLAPELSLVKANGACRRQRLFAAACNPQPSRKKQQSIIAVQKKSLSCCLLLQLLSTTLYEGAPCCGISVLFSHFGHIHHTPLR